MNVVARHRHAWRAELDREHSQADRIGDDRPAGLGLPPVIDHRHAQNLLGPRDRVRVGALARQEQSAQRRDVVVFDELGLRVLLAHGAQAGRRGEERGDLIVLDHPPISAGVRRPDRFALVKDAGAALQQRPIDDVGMADDPADVGAGPKGLAGLDIVDRRHRPFQRHQVSADVAHHALRRSGRPGSVENVERIGRGKVGAGRSLARRLGGVDKRGPVAVSSLVHVRLDLRALIEDAGRRLVPGERDREIEQRLVFDDPARLDAAARGQNDLRLGVVDAGRELLGGEAAEHHRMHGADARAGEHGDDRLGNHRHVDQHPVARRDPEIVSTAASVAVSSSSSR